MTADSLAPSFPGMSAPLAALIAKDIGEHVRSRRFLIGSVIAFLLLTAAAVVRVADFRQAHEERALFLGRWAPSVQEQIERDENVEVENTRSVSPLAVLSIGLEPVTPFRFTSTKEGLRLGASRAAQNTVDALFGYLDFAFVISTLLSLLALALTFDSICGEQSQGTLALVLSYPVSRRAFFASKIISNAVVAALCFLPSFVVTPILVAASGVPLMNGWHWVTYGIAALIYLIVFVTFGVAISARGGTPSNAALSCLLVWVSFAFLIPRGVGLAISCLFPASQAVELSLAEDAAVSQLKVQYSAAMKHAFEQYLSAESTNASRDENFRRRRNEALQEMRNRRRAMQDRIWDDLDRRETARQRWVEGLSIMSPTALFNGVAAELAWTGEKQRSHFIEEARLYDEKIGRPLAESRQAFFGRTPRGETNGIITYDDIRPYLLPFQPTWVPSRFILAGVIAPIMVLATYIMAGWFLGSRFLHALDVRLR